MLLNSAFRVKRLGLVDVQPAFFEHNKFQEIIMVDVCFSEWSVCFGVYQSKLEMTCWKISNWKLEKKIIVFSRPRSLVAKKCIFQTITHVFNSEKKHQTLTALYCRQFWINYIIFYVLLWCFQCKFANLFASYITEKTCGSCN